MPKKQHWCGFCGKPDDEVERLLAGPCIEVCNECIDMMHKLVHTPKPIFTVKPPAKQRTVIQFDEAARKRRRKS